VANTESQTVCRLDGCDKDYRDRKCLVRHIGSTHNKIIEILQQNGIPVPVGNGKRRNTEKLERNVRIKMEKNDSIDGSVTAHHCELCDKYFSSKSNLERHQKTPLHISKQEQGQLASPEY